MQKEAAILKMIGEGFNNCSEGLRSSGLQYLKYNKVDGGSESVTLSSFMQVDVRSESSANITV